MTWLRSFYGSAVGKKIVMALTGMILVGFVALHALGNLLMFQGPEAMNAYGALIKSSGALLWTLRIGLLVSVGLHVHSAWTLTRMNRAARPESYARLTHQSSTLSARTLRIGGVVLLAFMVFHILHFTTGTVHPAFDRHDVYGNVIVGFGAPLVAGFYLVAMAALGMHLHHGVWSLFQTLGLNHPHINPLRKRLALALAILVPVGFSAIVLAVAFGYLR